MTVVAGKDSYPAELLVYRDVEQLARAELFIDTAAESVKRARPLLG